MGDALHCSGPPVSEMTYTVLSGTLNYHTIPYKTKDSLLDHSLFNMPVHTAKSYTRLAASYVVIYRIYRRTFTSEVAYCVLNDMSNPVTDIVSNISSPGHLKGLRLS